MSTGLLASTWTPGRTAPEVSFTTPAMLLCAAAAAGSRRTHKDAASTARAIRVRVIERSLIWLMLMRDASRHEGVQHIPGGARLQPVSSGAIVRAPFSGGCGYEIETPPVVR